MQLEARVGWGAPAETPAPPSYWFWGREAGSRHGRLGWGTTAIWWRTRLWQRSQLQAQLGEIREQRTPVGGGVRLGHLPLPEKELTRSGHHCKGLPPGKSEIPWRGSVRAVSPRLNFYTTSRHHHLAVRTTNQGLNIWESSRSSPLPILPPGHSHIEAENCWRSPCSPLTFLPPSLSLLHPHPSVGSLCSPRSLAKCWLQPAELSLISQALLWQGLAHGSTPLPHPCSHPRPCPCPGGADFLPSHLWLLPEAHLHLHPPTPPTPVQVSVQCH